MHRLTRFTFSAALLSAALALPAQAQRAGAPSLAVAALNTTAAAEGLRPVRASVRPNDVLRYTLTFTNPTPRALGNVELKDPIPAGVHFVAGSTHSSRADARVEFSADNGRSWSEAPMETVQVNGQPVERPISASRFTHIRWVVGGKVAPRATVTADFEAKVDGPGA